ncbi:MAG: hypothetical protein H0Z33_02770 [Bacillaceae bacterium]|nr:hypothetical protein [Bacillaceae bacterium]
MDKKKFRLEAKFAEYLDNQKLKEKDLKKKALKHLSPRWEIRTMTERDPIVEETHEVRKYVKEVDDRYDTYLKQAKSKPDRDQDDK